MTDLLFPVLAALGAMQADSLLLPYVETLEREGRPPHEFVIALLDDVDLIVFDDAWHPAREPFDLYRELVVSPSFRSRATHVFLEVVPINKQQHLDAYFATEPEDATLLYPAFQDDFSGTGWPLVSYLDLLHAIYVTNRSSGTERPLSVMAVNAATYWSEIVTARDVELFRATLAGNDYTMYRTILSTLDGFDGVAKGIFLTNTRHAYKGIRDREGRLFWNAGTFLHQRHPGRTYSIRFHNLALSIAEERRDEGTVETTAGLERYHYSWVRMANGLWDTAFEAVGNAPIAVPLEGNVFGREAYVGNHMHRAAADQTMYDAYDAIIFLAPLEALHNSARTDAIYTPAFKAELARRYRILYTPEQLHARLEQAGAETLDELIRKDCAASPEELIPQAKDLPPKDAWKRQDSR